jgi:hypothetical protein
MVKQLHFVDETLGAIPLKNSESDLRGLKQLHDRRGPRTIQFGSAISDCLLRTLYACHWTLSWSLSLMSPIYSHQVLKFVCFGLFRCLIQLLSTEFMNHVKKPMSKTRNSVLLGYLLKRGLFCCSILMLYAYHLHNHMLSTLPTDISASMKSLSLQRRIGAGREEEPEQFSKYYLLSPRY